MKTFAAVLAAAGLMAVQAECPNGCSGHGSCGASDACTCFDNWMGGDCSQRVCPFGLSFVDTPVGDLNHDGAVSVGTVGVQWANGDVNEMWQGGANDGAHFYSECSGKGVCNRGSGECECYDGFSGSSCQRTTCPNDCSGHGQCYTLREIAAGPNTNTAGPFDSDKGRNYRLARYENTREYVEGVDEAFEYNLWDADKNQACVCDSGYFGPDCSMRDCPRGADPLSTNAKFCGDDACTAEVQQMIIYSDEPTDDATACYFFEWTDKAEYANLLAPGLRSETFCLRDGLTGDDYADIVQDAIDSFPNSALNGVTVTCADFDDGSGTAMAGTTNEYAMCSTALNANGSGGSDSAALLTIDFANGPQGDQNAITARLVSTNGASSGTVDISTSIQVEMHHNGVGATTTAGPLLAAISNAEGDIQTEVSFTAAGTSNGNTQNSPCSNRGICDYSSGECACFAGYTREDCSAQAALSM